MFDVTFLESRCWVVCLIFLSAPTGYLFYHQFSGTLASCSPCKSTWLYSGKSNVLALHYCGDRADLQFVNRSDLPPVRLDIEGWRALNLSHRFYSIGRNVVYGNGSLCSFGSQKPAWDCALMVKLQRTLLGD